jgi:hypothetical protein
MSVIRLKSVGNQGSCRSCGKQITWAVTIEGKNIPLEPASPIVPNGQDELWVDASESHWAHCQYSEQHRMKAEVQRLRTDNARLKERNQQLAAEVCRLKERLEARHGDD